MIRADP